MKKIKPHRENSPEKSVVLPQLTWNNSTVRILFNIKQVLNLNKLTTSNSSDIRLAKKFNTLKLKKTSTIKLCQTEVSVHNYEDKTFTDKIRRSSDRILYLNNYNVDVVDKVDNVNNVSKAYDNKEKYHKKNTDIKMDRIMLTD